jgi:hypothetical protein
MIDKVQKAAVKAKMDPMGHFYMPLDKDAVEEKHAGCAAGAVIESGEVLFGPEDVIWVKNEWGGLVESEPAENSISLAESSTSNTDVASIVAVAKSDLAVRLGIAVDKIDLTIRF